MSTLNRKQGHMFHILYVYDNDDRDVWRDILYTLMYIPSLVLTRIPYDSLMNQEFLESIDGILYYPSQLDYDRNVALTRFCPKIMFLVHNSLLLPLKIPGPILYPPENKVWIIPFDHLDFLYNIFSYFYAMRYRDVEKLLGTPLL